MENSSTFLGKSLYSLGLATLLLEFGAYASTNPPPIIDATSMAPQIVLPTGVYPSCTAIVDIDRDGKQDLIVGNGGTWDGGTEGEIMIFRNISTNATLTNGSFAAPVTFPTGNRPTQFAIGDIDRDGRPDVVVGSSSGNFVSVFQNQSTPDSLSFASRVSIPTGDTPYGVALGDVNKDGRLDLVVVNYNDHTLSVMRNTGYSLGITTSSFAPRVNFPSGSYPSCVAISDIDCDGNSDITVVSHGRVSLFRNTGPSVMISSNSFASRVEFPFNGTWTGGLAVGDLNGDLKPEVVVSCYSAGVVSVFRNTSTPGAITANSLAPRLEFVTGGSTHEPIIADLSGDGKPELIASSEYANTVSVFQNKSVNGEFMFGVRVDFPTGQNPAGIAVGDLNNDGKSDVTVANFYANTVSLFQNTGSSSVFEPQAGLISWWQAEANAKDSIGMNHGTIQGNVDFVPGKVGKAFSFAGNDQYIELPDAPSLNLTNAFTLQGWFLLPRYTENDCCLMVEKGSLWGVDLQYQLGMVTNGAGEWIFRALEFLPSGPTGVLGVTPVQLNTWYHVAMTHDGSYSKLYVNGHLEGTTAIDGAIISGTGAFTIGGQYFGNGRWNFPGLIDEVSLNNRALSQSEIQAIYTADSEKGPTIAAQPKSQTIPVGTNVTLSVVASGTQPLSYQWLRHSSVIAFATNASLTLSNVQISDTDYYSVIVTNAYGSIISSNALITVQTSATNVPAPAGLVAWWPASGNAEDLVGTHHGTMHSSDFLINVDFGESQGILTAGSRKTGMAAIGQTTADFWNFYTRDPFPTKTFGGVPNLRKADGTITSVGLTITNAVGAWSNHAEDPMYEIFLYPLPNGNGNITITVTNLPLGQYDFYIYGHGDTANVNGKYTLSQGNRQYGPLATADSGTEWQSSTWKEGQQYIVFRGVTVLSGQPVVLTCLPGSSVEALICGMQITQTASGYAEGKVGQAFSFNGTDQFVSVPDAPTLNPKNALTLEGWFLLTKYSTSDSVTIAQKGGAYDADRQYQLGMGNVGQWRFRSILWPTGGAVGFHGNTEAQLNTWYHVAMTYDGSFLKLYVNGKLDASQPATGSIINSVHPFLIGGDLESGHWNFPGLIDELSLYNRALSESEIQSIYTSASAGKSPNVLPTFAVQPQSQTTYTGTDVTFTCTASGMQPMSYQWMCNAEIIAGATNASLTLTNVQIGNSGALYSVSVTNLYGSAVSSNALLTVNSGWVKAPSGLLAWWQAESNMIDSVALNNGIGHGNVTFSPGKVGKAFSFDGTSTISIPDAPSLNASNALTVEGWFLLKQYSGNDSVAFAEKGGAYDADRQYMLGLGNVNGWRFRSVLWATGGAAGFHGSTVVQLNTWYHVAMTYDGSMLKLFVNGNLEGSQPASGSIVNGNCPVVIGGELGSARWNSTALVDELSLYNQALTGSEIQSVYNAGSTGKVIPPAILSQPVSQTQSAGGTATFSVTAAGTAPLSYQWYFGSTPISGASESTLSISNVQGYAEGSYYVVISNTAGSVTSSNAALTIHTADFLLNVDFGGGPVSAKVGWAATGQASNDFWSTYWHKFEFFGSLTNMILADRSTSTVGLTVENAPGHWGNGSQDPMYYNYIYAWSGSVTITVTNLPTAHYDFYVYGSSEVNQNGFYQLSNGGSSYGPLSTDATGTACQSTNWEEGQHYVVFRNISVTNNQPVVLNVLPGLSGTALISGMQIASTVAGETVPPVIVSQPVSQTVIQGLPVSFTTEARGHGPISYQWRLNGTNLSGATNRIYTIESAQLSDAGTYSAVATNAFGSVSSSNAVLTVNLAQCITAPSGLVSWWKGETSGADAMGVNPGTLVGGAGFAPGKVGQAFSFDGTSQHVRIENSPSLNPTGSFSIETWIYPVQSGLQAIFGKWGDWGDYENQRSYALTLRPENAIGFAISDDVHQWDTSFHEFHTPANSVELNRWTHVAAVYDQSTGTRRTYINGILAAERTDAPITVLNSRVPAAIGTYVSDTTETALFYKGKIDEFAFYNRALTASEIQSICTASIAGKATPPSFLTQPQSQTALVGSTVTLIANAIGTAPLSYQWKFNSDVINGATNASLTLTNVQIAASGVYSVVLTNPYGVSISSGASLTVKPARALAPAGMVAWWQAETNTVDSVGFNNGAVYGNVTFSPGKVGQAFSFDRTGCIDIPHAPSLNPTQAFTMEGWVLLTRYTTGDSVIIAEKGTQWGVDLQYQLGVVLVSGKWIFRALEFVPSGPTGVLGVTTAQLNTWYHVAMTHDGSFSKLYLNGHLEGSTAINGSIITGTGPFTIGGQNASGNSLWNFPGLVDELSVYNRALSETEIQSIYNAGSSGKSPEIQPSITAQPQSQNALAGATVTFSATVTGTRPLTYQWRLNSNIIAGATNATLILTNAQPADTGTYSVIVTNVCGSLISSNAQLTISIPVCGSATPNLVGWWRAEGNTKNASGLMDGIAQGNLSYRPGMSGQGFLLDGSSGAVMLGNPTNLQLQNFTIEAWIQRANPTLATAGGQAGGTVFGYGYGGYGFSVYNDGRLNLSKCYMGEVATQPGLVSDKLFHHVAVTKTGASVTFYVDGIAYPVADYNPDFVFSTPAAIGALGDGSHKFWGSIDEVLIYSRALTSTEIHTIYNAGLANKYATKPKLIIENQLTNVLVKWAFAERFALESSDITFTNWTPVTTPAKTNGSEVQVTIPLPNDLRFFRLKVK